MTTKELKIELVLEEPRAIHGTNAADGFNETWASIKVGGVSIYRELVYDNPESPAERNILNLFGDRLRRLIERN